MTDFFIKFIILSVQVRLCYNAKILGVFPIPSFSHQIVYQPIWRELALRGHEITIITSHPLRNQSLENLREIDISDAVTKLWTFDKVARTTNQFDSFREIFEFYKIMDSVTNSVLEHAQVQDLIKSQNQTFDLVILENYMLRLLGFVARFKCPYAGIQSTESPFYLHAAMGNPYSPIVYPDFILHYTPPLNFYQRIFSVLIRGVISIIFNLTFSSEDYYIQKYFGDDLWPLNIIYKNMSLLLSNTNPVFHQVRPLNPNTIEFGGGVHLNPHEELKGDVKEFLDGAKDGAVYVSFGSNINSGALDENLIEIIVETFKILKNLRFLWKFDRNLEDLPDNVKIVDWTPQQDVLRHENLKLFVNHGGLQSVEEAIHYQIPMVVMPLCSDLYGRADLIQKKGIGLSLDKTNINSATLSKAMLEVINDPKYKNAEYKLSRLILDQPMVGVEKAVWWIEYVIRHRGAQHLRPVAADVPFYQYYLLDVLALFLAVGVAAKWVWGKAVRAPSRGKYKMS